MEKKKKRQQENIGEKGSLRGLNEFANNSTGDEYNCSQLRRNNPWAVLSRMVCE
jgi:hypothetical protein